MVQSKEPGAYDSSRSQTFIEHLCYLSRQSREQMATSQSHRCHDETCWESASTNYEYYLVHKEKLLKLFEPRFPCLDSEL